MKSERQKVKSIISQGEGVRIEFKESRSKLSRNLFESISAMLNREGGNIFLGVNDSGKIIGIEKSQVQTIITNLVNLSNNSQKLDPPFILSPVKYTINKKVIIYLQIPCSSQVHKSGGIIFDRSNDGDFKATTPQQIAEIYNRKRLLYTEGIIYPKIQFSDFNPDLFPKLRSLIKSNDPDHPWLALSNEHLLIKAGLWKADFETNEEGYTLAAVLLLGKDEVIQQVLPHYKIDALVRKENINRYDDRLYIQTNLINAYDELMHFVAKHLPDKFYTEGDQRKSLRTAIFREIVANLIVHREYTNAFPATFIIYSDRVETRNANNPRGRGILSVNDFSPFPKNPLIAKFFMQLGRVDELGSGIINVNKFIKDYSGKDNPQFFEGEIFRITIPLANASVGKENEGAIEGTIEGAFGGATRKVKERLIVLLTAIIIEEGKRTPYYKNAIKRRTKKLSESSLQRYFKQLREANLIEFKGDSFQTGGYFLTDTLKSKLKGRFLLNPKETENQSK